MSTNYYWRKPGYEETCSCCGRDNKPIYIGLSIPGWVFALRSYGIGDVIRIGPTKTLLVLPKDLLDWQRFFDMPGSQIVDDYGDYVGAAKMMSIILIRGDAPNRRSGNPNASPEGETYDLVKGEFA